MKKQTNSKKQNSKIILEELEARQLFSGGLEGIIVNELESPIATYVDIDSTKDTTSTQQETSIASAAEVISQEIVFIDTGVEDYQTLVDDILNNSDTSRNIEVVLLNSNENGIDVISSTLQDRNDLDAIHIISHSDDGTVQRGTTSLNADTLADNNLAIALWANSFDEAGDILIYGCNLAETEVGESLIGNLAELILADVAASDDLTGHASLGGDWVLEYSQGQIETAALINQDTADQWHGLLAPPVITNLAGDELAYTEGDRAVVIEQGSDIVVTDADSADFNTGTLTVSFAAGSDSTEDILGIHNQGYGAGQISIAGWGVAYGGTLIGSFEGGANGDDLVITFNANADAAAVQALIENITYENTDADNATTGARTVRFVLNDGDGDTSANYDTTVNVSTINDSPTFDTGDGKVTTDFGSGNDYGRSVTVQSDGKILVAGTTNSEFTLTRYNADGSLDTTFDGDGKVTTDVSSGSDSGYSVTVQSDGRILVAGYSTDGYRDFALVRYNVNG